MPSFSQLLLADHAGQVHRHQEQREPVVAGVADRSSSTSTITWARWPLVMNVFEPLITYSSPSLTARVLIPATSEPASGSVIPRQRIFLPLIAGHDPLLLLLLGAEREDRRHRHVGLDREPHRQAAAVGVAHLLGEHQARVVVAALAAVLLGLVEPEEAELAHPLEHPVRERRLLPLLGVGLELLDHEAADRLAQLLVLVGEDEVLALGGEVGLEDVGGGGHARDGTGWRRESKQ